MIKVDFCGEEIEIKQPIKNYNELLSKIKSEFLLNDEEVKGLSLYYIDEKYNKNKLLPQNFQKFNKTSNKKIEIDVQENSMIYNECLNLNDDENNNEDINNIINNNSNKFVNNQILNKNNDDDVNIEHFIIKDNEEEENINKSLVLSKIIQDTKNKMEQKKLEESIHLNNNINNLNNNNINNNINNINDLNTDKNDMLEKLKNLNIDFIQENENFEKNKNKETFQKKIEKNFNEFKNDIINSTLVTSSKYSMINLSNYSNVIHNNIRCNGCNMFPIIGIRYCCSVCNSNFCSDCEQKIKHTHPLFKIKKPAA